MMFESVMQVINGILNPVASIIDELHTSAEEKLKLRQAFLNLQTQFSIEMAKIDLEMARLQAKVIEAENTNGNWLQRSWRPVTMLVFLALIILDTFGLLSKPLNDHVWTLLQIGIGGYVIGRSVEKSVNVFKNKGNAQ